MNKTWRILNDSIQLKQIQNESNYKKQVLFKHSTNCGVSFLALERLESNWDFTAEDFDFYYLDLLKYRAISNEIAAKWNIRHQSPQIIVIEKEKAIVDFSHHIISAEYLKKKLVP